ncbi:MAG TPA: hypothetical protein VFL60_07040 [Gaiellaceae bacterium]|nr:hypothetical protein [Gaiellaceae bacterium]
MSADEIRGELEAARAEARRLAAEQQAWRSQVFALYERAREAGMTLDEIVEALGLSGKWAEHLRARERRRMQIGAPKFFFGGPGF